MKNVVMLLLEESTKSGSDTEEFALHMCELELLCLCVALGLGLIRHR